MGKIMFSQIFLAFGRLRDIVTVMNVMINAMANTMQIHCSTATRWKQLTSNFINLRCVFFSLFIPINFMRCILISEPEQKDETTKTGSTADSVAMGKEQVNGNNERKMKLNNKKEKKPEWISGRKGINDEKEDSSWRIYYSLKLLFGYNLLQCMLIN